MTAGLQCRHLQVASCYLAGMDDISTPQPNPRGSGKSCRHGGKTRSENITADGYL